jgi:hypothetical protein
MKIVLGGIVRNIESHFVNILNFINALKNVLPSLEVCLYENNSTDSTKTLLDNMKEMLDYITIVKEDYSEEFFINSFPARTYDNKGCRIHKIAHARNQLLKMIDAKNLGSEDFVIMMDLDIKISPDVNIISHIINNFYKNNNIDVLFANGVQHNGHYYDSYEFRSETYPYGPEIIGEAFWSDSHLGKIQQKYTDFVPVISAFGGLAIYRAHIIKGCSYSADVTDTLHEYYSGLPIFDPNPTTHYLGCSLGTYLKDKKIFYKNNSGYNYPVAAEHVNFHLEIRKKGFINMFICPFLFYVWG